MLNNPSIVLPLLSYFFSFIFTFITCIVLNRRGWKIPLSDMLWYSLFCYLMIPLMLYVGLSKELTIVVKFFITEPLKKLFKPLIDKINKVLIYITGKDLY